MTMMGRMANALRKNTIWPSGTLSPMERTSVDITANSKTDSSLMETARRIFIAALMERQKIAGCDGTAPCATAGGAAEAPPAQATHVAAGCPQMSTARCDASDRRQNSQRSSQGSATCQTLLRLSPSVSPGFLSSFQKYSGLPL